MYGCRHGGRWAIGVPYALGGTRAPDLTQVVRTLDLRRFAKLVLLRYDWLFSPSSARRDNTACKGRVDEVHAALLTAALEPRIR